MSAGQSILWCPSYALSVSFFGLIAVDVTCVCFANIAKPIFSSITRGHTQCESKSSPLKLFAIFLLLESLCHQNVSQLLPIPTYQPILVHLYEYLYELYHLLFCILCPVIICTVLATSLCKHFLYWLICTSKILNFYSSIQI